MFMVVGRREIVEVALRNPRSSFPTQLSSYLSDAQKLPTFSLPQPEIYPDSLVSLDAAFSE